MAEDQTSSARANARDAIAAFEAVGIYAKAQPPVVAASDRRRDPEQDDGRLYRLLGALQHLAGNLSGISFTEALRAAREEYERQRVSDGHLALARRAAVAELAIEACECGTGSLGRYRRGFWPPDTLADLRRYADGQGIGFEAAMSRLMVWLLADLRHYVDRQGIDFAAAITAGERSYAEQRLGAEVPFETGLDRGQRLDTVLVPSITAPPFRPVPTHQGIITSFADAEWHLVRTAARIDYQARHAPASSYEPDEDDISRGPACRGMQPGRRRSPAASTSRRPPYPRSPARSTSLRDEHVRPPSSRFRARNQPPCTAAARPQRTLPAAQPAARTTPPHDTRKGKK